MKEENMQDITSVTRTKEQAKESYNKMSKSYDSFGRFERKYKIEGLTKLRILQQERILEIGFGTGSITTLIAEAVGEGGMVHGIDLSEKMKEIAQLKINKLNFERRVKLETGDACKLPYSSDFFDGIYISFTLELFDTTEIPIVLQECQRVLKHGGRICIISLSKKGKHKKITKFYEWIHKKYPVSIDCRPIYAEEALKQSSFTIKESKLMNMWGLGVEIILGIKTREDRILQLQ
jgi:ubiquinone/menaquinone biosynthesis C-methylase UbiE